MGGVISLTTEYSEAGPKKSYHKKKKKKKKPKKYSRAWWKWYKAKQKKQRMLAARKKMLKARQERLAARNVPSNSPQILPNGEPLPNGWRRAGSGNNEMLYIVDDEMGRSLGTASFALVGFANPSNEWRKNKTLAGVELSALRRIVINKMIREQGWIVNDYQKEINGKKVFVVVAQSQNANGTNLSRMFYFTEVDGKIYSLATNSSPEVADKMAELTEKVLANFGRGSAERAGLK
jgi:hypothetical protein